MEFSTIKIVIVLTTFLGGVFYCGWACPFGFIQDIGSRIGKKLGVSSRQIPSEIHKVIVYLRYILAVATVAITADYIMRLMTFEARGAFTLLIGGRIPTTAGLISITLFFYSFTKVRQIIL